MKEGDGLMTVGELIKELEALPQDAKVLTMVQGDFAEASRPVARWARSRDGLYNGWWQVYWGTGSPKFSTGFEQVAVIQ